jgi:hypothetical protein
MAGVALLRWLRASMLSLVVVLGGLAGHVAAGGVTPTGSTVLMMLVATGVLVAPMLGAPASTGRVVVLVAAGQGAVHLALQFLAPPARTGHSGSSMLMPGAMSSGMSSRHASMTGEVLGHGSAAHHDAVLALMNGTDLAMLAGHLAAAVVVGLWLAAGERAAWSIVALTGRSVADSLRGLLQGMPLRPALAGTCPSTEPMPDWLAAVLLRASVWDGYAVSRRGPPGC